MKYIRTRLNADKYWRVTDSGFIFSVAAEGGYIHPLENRGSAAAWVSMISALTDRFYLGEPQMRGFDIRGIGPRIQRIQFTPEIQNGAVVNVPITDRNQDTGRCNRWSCLLYGPCRTADSSW